MSATHSLFICRLLAVSHTSLTQEFHIFGIGKIGIFGTGVGGDGRLFVGHGRHFGIHGKTKILLHW